MQELLHLTPTIDNTVGALLLGIITAAVLFGITVLQGFLYFERYPRDNTWHRVAVGSLWALDAVHFALAIHVVWVYTIKAFTRPEILLELIWSLKAQVAVNVVIILMVQSLYTYRAWLLGGYHKGFVHYVAILILAVGFGMGISLSVKLAQVPYFVGLKDISWAIDGSLATATAIDVSISCAMCYYLVKSRSPSTELNTRIAKLIHFTLSSGILICATSTACLTCYVLWPDTMIFIALELLLTKIYVNSFLAMLNARTPSNVPQSTSQYESRNTLGALRSPPPPHSQRSVQYEISVIRTTDDEMGIALEGIDENKSGNWGERHAEDRQAPTYAIGW